MLLQNHTICNYLLLSACLLAQQTAKPNLPTEQSIRLTIVEKANTKYSFGSVRAGQVVSHSFTLRNDTGSPIAIKSFLSTCGCLTLPLQKTEDGKLPVLKPGDTTQITVILDTAQIAASETVTLSGSEIGKQVWVYAEGEPVHPAAILEMRGRISYGVSFSPPIIDFGRVNQAQGSSRLIKVTYDSNLYLLGKTRLVSSDPVVVVSKYESGSLHAAAVTPKAIGKTIDVIYRVSAPPHSAIGMLSGVLTVEGLVSPKSSSGSNDSKLAFPKHTLPFVGRITGNYSVQPGMAVFGVVRKDPENTPEEDVKRRTRWVLLIANPAQNRKPIVWGKTAIANDSTWFTGAIVSPILQKTAKPGVKPGPDMNPPFPETVKPELARWIRVTLSADAPVGKPLESRLHVTLPDGEHLILPVQALRK